ncbi:MAG: MBL fold metallo-hydrolase [Bacteroidales bacterium]|nr:MBL fold metallo-hydrolase [Bacteroidales bacterium]
MKITVLGSGTSQGVPVIACDCDVCKSNDPLDKRLRSSIMIESEGTTIVVDAGPDFRQQLLREKVKKVDAILITHCHKDHIAGLDDVRSFNYLFKKAMRVYAAKRDQLRIKEEFSYAFTDDKYPGVPDFDLINLDEHAFQIDHILIQPIKVRHMHLSVYGFRIGDFAYITDVNFIPEESMQLLRGVKILIIDALRKYKHPSHFTLDEAIEVAKQLGSEQTFFTHISHLMGKSCDINPVLPEGMSLAWDGLQIEI